MQQNKSGADQRFKALLTTQIIGMLLLAALIGVVYWRLRPNDAAENWQAVAAKLKAVGETRQAAEFYEKYFEHAPVRDKAKFAVALGELYEELGQPDRALAWRYVAQANGDGESAKEIVRLLERLGKSTAAKQALSESTVLGGSKKESKDEVVAAVGSRKFYLSELLNRYDHLPDPFKKEFSGKEGKLKLLQKWVADEILYEKALRLQWDRDPQVSQKIKDVQRDVLVGKVLEEEVFNKIQVEERDLENYYRANQNRYKGKVKQVPPLSEVRSQVEMDYRLEKGQSLYAKLVEQTLANEKVELFAEKLP